MNRLSVLRSLCRALRSAASALVVVSLSASLGACSGAAERLAVMEGNLAARKGRNREAVAAYLRASSNPAVAPYGDYGLARIYLALGETSPALDRFFAAETAAADTGNTGRELLYCAAYNAGIVRFRSGDFTGAAQDFRRALEADSNRMNAKRNLELSMRSLSRKSSAASSSAPLGTRNAGTEPKTLFDFIREKESDRWKSRTWKAESSSAADY